MIFIFLIVSILITFYNIVFLFSLIIIFDDSMFKLYKLWI